MLHGSFLLLLAEPPTEIRGLSGKRERRGSLRAKERKKLLGARACLKIIIFTGGLIRGEGLFEGRLFQHRISSKLDRKNDIMFSIN